MGGSDAKLTVLGCSPSWQNAGGACSSYLVEQAGTRLLLDLGNGAFSVLRGHSDYAGIDAVVISHTHGDHVLDLVPFAYALIYSPRAQAGALQPPKLFLPPGATDRLRAIFDLIDRAALLDDAYEVHEYDPAGTLEVGDLTVDFLAVPHFVPAYAIGVSNGTGRLVYGADSRPSPELAEFARGAGLLLLEATLQAPEATGPRGHMTPEEAAATARDAGAGTLVLTHVTDELPGDEWVRRARSVHADSVLAESLATYAF